MKPKWDHNRTLIEVRSLLDAIIASVDYAKYASPATMEHLLQSNDDVRKNACKARKRINSELYDSMGQIDELSIPQPEPSRMERPQLTAGPSPTSTNPTDEVPPSLVPTTPCSAHQDRALPPPTSTNPSHQVPDLPPPTIISPAHQDPALLPQPSTRPSHHIPALPPPTIITPAHQDPALLLPASTRPSHQDGAPQPPTPGSPPLAHGDNLPPSLAASQESDLAGQDSRSVDNATPRSGRYRQQRTALKGKSAMMVPKPVTSATSSEEELTPPEIGKDTSSLQSERAHSYQLETAPSMQERDGRKY